MSRVFLTVLNMSAAAGWAAAAGAHESAEADNGLALGDPGGAAPLSVCAGEPAEPAAGRGNGQPRGDDGGCAAACRRDLCP